MSATRRVHADGAKTPAVWKGPAMYISNSIGWSRSANADKYTVTDLLTLHYDT